MDWQQKLVNAQVEVNRVVFDANRSRPRPDYILERIDEARSDLLAAQQLLRRRKKSWPKRDTI
jgi:hypothetical protein